MQTLKAGLCWIGLFVPREGVELWYGKAETVRESEQMYLTSNEKREPRNFRRMGWLLLGQSKGIAIVLPEISWGNSPIWSISVIMICFVLQLPKRASRAAMWICKRDGVRTNCILEQWRSWDRHRLSNITKMNILFTETDMINGQLDLQGHEETDLTRLLVWNWDEICLEVLSKFKLKRSSFETQSESFSKANCPLADLDEHALHTW
jgi:hypothetical protein